MKLAARKVIAIFGISTLLGLSGCETMQSASQTQQPPSPPGSPSSSLPSSQPPAPPSQPTSSPSQPQPSTQQTSQKSGEQSRQQARQDSQAADQAETAGAQQEQQQKAGSDLKKAGEKVAQAGAQIGDVAEAGSRDMPPPLATPTGNEEWDPLLHDMPPSQQQSDDLVFDDPDTTDEVGATPAGGEMSSDDLLSDEIQAAQEALLEAGITLQQAGDAIENAQSDEDLAAAAELLSKARIIVIVASQDLMEARETQGAGNEAVFDEAEQALNDATIAIVGATGAVMTAPDYGDVATDDMEAGGNAGELEDELEQSLIVFDQQILSARTRVEQPGAPPSPELPDEHSMSTGNVLSGSTGNVPEDDAEVAEAKETGSNSEGDTPMKTRQEGDEREVAINIPEEIGSGQDDDIVAQQLREAAIAETDPRLQEKLWEEYKRYKAGL